MRHWHYIEPLDVSFGITPKCGVHSLKHWLSERWGYSQHSEPLGSSFIFICRNPVARFKSLWKFCSRDNQGHGKGQNPMLGLTPKELIEHIETSAPTEWTMTQSSALGNVKASIVRIENAGLPVKNKTQGDVSLSKDVVDRVLRFYDADVSLYKEAV